MLSSVNLCEHAPPDTPDAGGGMCCLGAAVHGPHACTCWVPVYDLEQEEPRPAPPRLCDQMCGDCAYRPGSPERSNEPGYRGDAEFLQAIVASGDPFWCHQGIRRVVRWVHRPDEVTAEACAELLAELGQERVGEVPAGPASYEPPILDGVPYRADGTPAALCAGWMKRAKADRLDPRVLAAINGGVRVSA